MITRDHANNLATANGWIFHKDRRMDTACNVCGQVGATNSRGAHCLRKSPKWANSRVCPGIFVEVVEGDKHETAAEKAARLGIPLPTVEHQQARLDRETGDRVAEEPDCQEEKA